MVKKSYHIKCIALSEKDYAELKSIADEREVSENQLYRDAVRLFLDQQKKNGEQSKSSGTV